MGSQALRLQTASEEFIEAIKICHEEEKKLRVLLPASLSTALFMELAGKLADPIEGLDFAKSLLTALNTPYKAVEAQVVETAEVQASPSPSQAWVEGQASPSQAWIGIQNVRTEVVQKTARAVSLTPLEEFNWLHDQLTPSQRALIVKNTPKGLTLAAVNEILRKALRNEAETAPNENADEEADDAEGSHNKAFERHNHALGGHLAEVLISIQNLPGLVERNKRHLIALERKTRKKADGSMTMGQKMVAVLGNKIMTLGEMAQGLRALGPPPSKNLKSYISVVMSNTVDQYGNKVFEAVERGKYRVVTPVSPLEQAFTDMGIDLNQAPKAEVPVVEDRRSAADRLMDEFIADLGPDHDLLQKPICTIVSVLQTIRRAPDKDKNELAELMGTSAHSLNIHLANLKRWGWVMDVNNKFQTTTKTGWPMLTKRTKARLHT
jgi:hypothetical protein